MAATLEELEARVVTLETFRENARERIKALENEVDSLRQTAREKLREHLRDHADAGNDFRTWSENKARNRDEG